MIKDANLEDELPGMKPWKFKNLDEPTETLEELQSICRLQPTGKRILIIRFKQSEKQGAIHIAEVSRMAQSVITGLVLRVGPDVINIQEGDRLHYRPMDIGCIPHPDSDDFITIPEDAIMGIYTDPPRVLKSKLEHESAFYKAIK